MRTRSLRLMKAFLRLTAVVLLVSMGGAIPANIAVAFSDLCCTDCEDEHDEGSDEHEHEQDCECPLGCATCCSGSLVRAVQPAAEVTIDVPVRRSDALQIEPWASPPAGVSRDILHVPKLVG